MNTTRSELKELAGLFLRLGFTAFGGPAAHTAMMRNEVVDKKKWISDQHFLDLVGATNLIPGPNSTELAIHIGYERAGWKGLLIAGLCFILPAVIISGLLGYFYFEYKFLPNTQSILNGIKPAVIAVVIMAIVPMTRISVNKISTGLIALSVLCLAILGANELILMFGAGIAMFLIWLRPSRSSMTLAPILLTSWMHQDLSPARSVKLFLIFLKIGAILYGSGYVLFAFIDSELVSTGLLSRSDLVNAIAVGQFTPGPVFSSVTFIGYQMGGWKGSVSSTIGIFLPAFVFVLILRPLMNALKNSQAFRAFLDGINAASIAIIIAVCINMSLSFYTDWKSLLIMLFSFIALVLLPKLNNAWVILGGAILGWISSMI